jgi:hypothetical protein
MMMSDFRKEIEDYLDRHEMAPSNFGRRFLNDPGFVFRLRNGGECRFETMEKLREEMAKASTPEDAA